MKEFIVFISSPSDVEDERKIISKVIDEINWYYEPIKGIPKLKPISSEDARPKITNSHPQTVIDEQIDKYDLYLGIFGNKYGTPTEKYGSGTVHEFYNALEKLNEDPKAIEISVYFSTQLPTNKNEANMNDLLKIEKFKEEISGKGLYKEYESIDKFEEIIRRHLRSFILEKSSVLIEEDYEDKFDERIGEYLEILTDEISKI